MKKISCISLIFVLAAMFFTGCGDDDSGISDEVDRVTIQGAEYPIVSGAEIERETEFSMAYRVDSEPGEVKQWFDETMEAEGWRFRHDWASFGDKEHKTYIRGESRPQNAELAEENVKISVGPAEGGGSIFVVSPVISSSSDTE